MNDVEKKRQAILKAYPTKSWENQVKTMPAHQVIALHTKFRSQNKI